MKLDKGYHECNFCIQVLFPIIHQRTLILVINTTKSAILSAN